MLPLDDQQQAARDWFEALRDRIAAAFEAIEREAGSDAAFTYIPWDRAEPDGEPGGGGVPEPAVWMSLVMGFGLLGAALRRRRKARGP